MKERMSVRDYNIVVSEFELRSRYYVHFRTNTLRNENLLYSPTQLSVKQYNYCSITRKALALNNPRMLICH